MGGERSLGGGGILPCTTVKPQSKSHPDRREFQVLLGLAGGLWRPHAYPLRAEPRAATRSCNLRYCVSLRSEGSKM